MEAMLNFIPAPVAIILMLAGFIALVIGGIRLGYKATVKDLALELVEKAELSIMGSGQGAKKKKQVFAALRAKCPAAIRWAITDEVMMVKKPVGSVHLVRLVQLIGQLNKLQTAVIVGTDDMHIRGGAVIVGPDLHLNGCRQVFHGSPLFGRGGNVALHEHQECVRIPQPLVIGNTEHGHHLLTSCSGVPNRTSGKFPCRTWIPACWSGYSPAGRRSPTGRCCPGSG